MQTSAKLKLQLQSYTAKKIMSVFPRTQNKSVFSPFVTAELMPLSYFHMKHKTKLKCKQNVALYNTRDLNDA